MVAGLNELPWQQDESLYLSHFLRHRKLKFSIQIPPDLRKESFGYQVDLVTIATQKFHLVSHC